MDTLPLPPRPSLAQYKKRAKDLVAAANSKAGDAVRAWAADWLASLARLRGEPITPFVQGSFDRAVGHIAEGVREKLASTAAADLRFRLADAQFLIALAHGFKNWAEFSTHVERLTRPNGDAFETAADAVVGGDGSPIITALVFGYGDAAETLARRGARADNILVAAALGRQDLVKRFVVDAVTLAPDARLVDTRWLRVPRDPQAHIELALVWAIK